MAALENELATVLTDLAQKLAAELPAAEALAAILAGAVRIIPCDQALILGYEGERFVPLAVCGPDSSSTASTRTDIVPEPSALLPQAGAAVCQAQVVSVSRAPSSAAKPGAAQSSEWLVAPLVLGQRLVGMLCLAAPTEARYDDATVKLAAPFAAYATLVIDRARLLQDVLAERQRRTAAEQDLARERAGRGQRLAEDGAAYAANLMAANDELARAARMKDEFLAAMSHELRTPLNTILGMTEVLLGQVFGTLNERQERSLRHVAESGKHLLELINDILDVAKIESGQMKLHVDIVDLPALCTGSLELVRPAAERKQISLALELDPEVSHLQGDGRRVRQILVNLLNNAVKFTPAGGQVGLRVAGDRPHGAVYLTVWDTGIGIDAADLPRLFKPFVQIDSSLSRHAEGTGLGLTIVQRFSQLHGGSVTVDSQKDAGSRFTVALPWTEWTRGSRSEPGTVKETGAGVTYRADDHPDPGRHLILVVDEYEPALQMLAAELAELGYAVETAHGGVEAIQKVDRLRPALVMMDTRLAGLDVVRTLRQISQNSGQTEMCDPVPVIILTALAIPGDRERCLAAGAVEFLVKPQGGPQLQPVLRRHLPKKHVGTTAGVWAATGI